MSVENAERLLRLMARDAKLRRKIDEAGQTGFEAVAAQAGASCTSYDVVRAIVRSQQDERAGS